MDTYYLCTTRVSGQPNVNLALCEEEIEVLKHFEKDIRPQGISLYTYLENFDQVEEDFDNARMTLLANVMNLQPYVMDTLENVEYDDFALEVLEDTGAGDIFSQEDLNSIEILWKEAIPIPEKEYYEYTPIKSKLVFESNRGATDDYEKQFIYYPYDELAMDVQIFVAKGNVHMIISSTDLYESEIIKYDNMDANKMMEATKTATYPDLVDALAALGDPKLLFDHTAVLNWLNKNGIEYTTTNIDHSYQSPQ